MTDHAAERCERGPEGLFESLIVAGLSAGGITGSRASSGMRQGWPSRRHCSGMIHSMSSNPVSDEIVGALGQFLHGGIGPSHSTLTGVFTRAGFGDIDGYSPGDPSALNKEARVQLIVRAAVKRSGRSRELVDGLLTALRVQGAFSSTDLEARQRVETAQAAFRREGWSLADDGSLSPLGTIDLVTGGRQALDEQLERLRRASNDPAQLLGTAKDLLEAVAKFVLEELEYPAPADFNSQWYLARERLGVHPNQVVGDSPGAVQVRKILGASWTIAEQVNELRNLQGTGHGRTLPTGVSADVALLVVREACSIAQFILNALDRALGH